MKKPIAKKKKVSVGKKIAKKWTRAIFNQNKARTDIELLGEAFKSKKKK